MTTILSWVSVDPNGISSIYVVGDSRITWGSELKRWDSGRKVFALRTPDIFGYCGDVLYPSLVLSQLGDLIDRDLLWKGDADASTRHATVIEYLETSFGRRHDAPENDFTIVHCARDGESISSSFYAWKTSYRAASRCWVDEEVPIGSPRLSTVIITLGSGNRALLDEIAVANAGAQGGTARSIFTAFCDSLARGTDPLSGGVPQIVSLKRESGGAVVGFIDGDTRYLHGLPIQPLEALESVEWRDALFQRLSPTTLDLTSGAQRHARVKTPAPGGFANFMKKVNNLSSDDDH